MKVPKHVDANLRWRSALLQEAENDSGLQRDLIAACSASILFWVNGFCFTYKKMEYGEYGDKAVSNPHVPFLTWWIQDDYLLKLFHAISVGESILTDKSRDMGATWCLVTALQYFWQFVADKHFLELSHKEEAVDSPGKKGVNAQANISTLFGKHDYLYNWQPAWMRPARTRSTLHMVNRVNQSRIDGESANATAGTSARKDAVLIDEMAKMQHGAAIKQSLMAVAPCLLPNSTPYGAGTAYSKWRLSGKVKVFVLPWWEHPEKGLNRRLIEGGPNEPPVITSPWYEAKGNEMTPQEIATELDMDHVGSGQIFFDAPILLQHKQLFGRRPSHRFSIGMKPKIANAAIADIIRQLDSGATFRKPALKGNLCVWGELIKGRPDQLQTYALGVDISKGMKASNSAVTVTCVQTREKIAEFATATSPPHDFVRTVVAIALWVGGGARGHLPIIIHEANGDPGIAFGRMLVEDFQYPYFYRDKAIGRVDDHATARYGWWSTQDKKSDLLSMYRRALAHGGIINHSIRAIEEAELYVYYENGGIGPALLEVENASAKKTHGDRVIADALSLLGCGESVSPATRIIAVPQYSTAWFQARLKKRVQKKKRREQRYPEYKIG